MAIEFVVEAFAVVVIGGLGSMRGRDQCGDRGTDPRAFDRLFPEFEVIAIYVIVIGV